MNRKKWLEDRFKDFVKIYERAPTERQLVAFIEYVESVKI